MLSFSLKFETRWNTRSSACRNFILLRSGCIPAKRCSTPKSREFWVIFNTSTKLQRLGWLPLSTEYNARWAASAILFVLSLLARTRWYWFHKVMGIKGGPLAPISLMFFYILLEINEICYLFTYHYMN